MTGGSTEIRFIWEALNCCLLYHSADTWGPRVCLCFLSCRGYISLGRILRDFNGERTSARKVFYLLIMCLYLLIFLPFYLHNVRLSVDSSVLVYQYNINITLIFLFMSMDLSFHRPSSSFQLQNLNGTRKILNPIHCVQKIIEVFVENINRISFYFVFVRFIFSNRIVFYAR